MSEENSNQQPNKANEERIDIELQDAYRRSVENLLKANSSEVISNGQPAHAAILLELFFRHAETEVLIFCRNLLKDVFDRETLVNAAEAALTNRGIRIRVISQTKPDESLFLKWLKEKEKNSNVSNTTCVPDSDAAKMSANFAVMDERAYRFEENRDDVKAVACMNDRNLSSKLAYAFRVFALSSQKTY